MKHEFEPSVDPWELMIEHNQRIQRIEKQVQDLQISIQNHKGKIEQLIQAVNTNSELQRLNQDTMNRLLDNHTALSGLVADIATKSSASGMGQH
jgi:Na+-translocating ferredoxin:NAD+ oxidoreductase RnfC subunit